MFALESADKWEVYYAIGFERCVGQFLTEAVAKREVKNVGKPVGTSSAKVGGLRIFLG